MPRPNKGARLWLKPAELDRKTGKVRKNPVWVIRDGPISVVTGCSQFDHAGAEQALANYIAAKYRPGREKGKSTSEILVTDVLTIYAEDVVPGHARPEKTDQRLLQLAAWWQGKTLADVTGRTCRAYTTWRTSQAWKSARPEVTGKPARMVTAAGVRRELEDLRAAINHHRSEGYTRDVVEVPLPDRSPPAVRWLTRSEAARLLWACWRHRETQHVGRGDRKGELIETSKRPWRHLARFVLIGLYTGTRSKAICTAALTERDGAGFADVEGGVFYRLAVGQRATNKRQPPVRLPPRLLAHMRRWAKDRGDDTIAKEFLVEFAGQPIGEPNKGFAQAVIAAGLDPEDVTPHVLRHTCATWLMQGGADMWDAAGFLGMSVAMLERTYGHHHPDHQASALAAAGGRRKVNKPSQGDRMGTETPRTDGHSRSSEPDAA